MLFILVLNFAWGMSTYFTIVVSFTVCSLCWIDQLLVDKCIQGDVWAVSWPHGISKNTCKWTDVYHFCISGVLQFEQMKHLILAMCFSQKDFNAVLIRGGNQTIILVYLDCDSVGLGRPCVKMYLLICSASLQIMQLVALWWCQKGYRKLRHLEE